MELLEESSIRKFYIQYSYLGDRENEQIVSLHFSPGNTVPLVRRLVPLLQWATLARKTKVQESPLMSNLPFRLTNSKSILVKS